MSQTIDQRVVEMRFDNAQFESGVQTSLSSIAKLKQSLNFTGTSKGLEDISNAAKKVDMTSLGSAIDSVKVKFSALQVVAATALSNITNTAFNAGKRIVSALTIDPIKTGFEEYETQINAIQTILANTQSKGSTLEDVNEALDELNTYADKTIYNFTEMTRNIGTFTAAGVDLDKSVTSIKGIANLAAISGSSAQQASTAMYQLSQALAAGKVQLMDWNSVVNAGMGGEVFQKALVRTAEHFGTNVTQMIEDYGSFRESLTEGGWLTSEVLTETLTQLSGAYTEADLIAQGYTEQQAKDIVELANTAVDAATKVKTFTQLWDTLKEAVQSGWTQSWEIIIGDFEEARGLLTQVSDTLGGFIAESANARNQVLQDWKDLGGRTAIIDSIRNTFEGLLSVITPIKEAFREVFPSITGEQLASFSNALRDLTENFKMGKETADNLKMTFKGLFAVLDIVRQAIVAVFNAVAPLFGGLDDLGGGFLSVTAMFGNWLVKIDEGVKKINLFNNVLQPISKLVVSIGTAIGNLAKTIKSKLSDLNIFGSFFDNLQQRMTQAGETAGKMGSGFSAALNAMGDAIANSNLMNALQSLWEGIRSIFGGIVTMLGDFVGSLAETIGGADFSNVFDVLNTAAFGGFTIAITNFLKTIRNPIEEISDSFEGFNGILENVTGILDGVKGSLEAYQSQLKAGTLLKIASAIGILAASILVISTIDSEKLSASLGAVTVLFANLMTSMALFGKISGPITGVVKTSTAMITLSVAVLILASALKKVADLDFDDLVKGLVGVAGLSTMMVASAKILGRGSATIIKGATQMVIFAAAIKILASACEDLSQFDWEELGKGLLGVGALLTEVSLFLNATKFSGQTITTATGIVILAAAIKVLASACEDFSRMKWEEIGKGLTSVGTLLAELAIFAKLTSNATNIVSTGVALIAIGAAMKVLASAVNDFSNMRWDEIARGLTGMAGALLAVTVAVKLMPSNIISIGVGLTAVSAALIVLSEALGRFNGMSWDEIARGLTALGGSMLVLAIALNAMNGTLTGSAALLTAAGALAVMAPVLKTLGDMSLESIGKSILVLAGAFTVIGAAGAVLTPLIPAIISLAGSFALIGVAVLGIGAGLLAAGTGLSALAVGFSALAAAGVAGATAFVSALTVIITGIAGLIPEILKKLGEGIIVLAQVIAEGAPEIAEAIKTVVLSLVDVLVECVPAIADGALELITGVLEALVKYTPRIVDAIFQFLINILDGVAKNLPELIQSAVKVIVAFFNGIVDALSGIDTTALLKMIAGIGLLSGIMVALSTIASLIPGAMAGVLGLGVLIAELALVLAAVGGLAQIPGLDWLINEGATLLESIGNAIGSFIGGIVGGVMQGVTNQLPKIGSDLSGFMTNIQPFINGARAIDPSVLDGVKSLAETILILTAANVLDGLTSWLTGGSSLTKFAQELVPFGQAMRDFSLTIAGMDGALVANAATAGKALAEMAATIPNSGGIFGFFTGENDMTTFSAQLVPFGKAMKDFSVAVAGMDSNAVVNAATAGKALAEMATTIPNSRGVVSFFTGENDMAAFGNQLIPFGEAMKEYSVAVSGMDTNAVVNSATAGKALAELASTIPNYGSLFDFFTGKNDMTAFGEQIVSFGKSFKSYADSVKGINADVVTSTSNAAKSLVTLTESLPDNKLFQNETWLNEFGLQLSEFGRHFKAYYDNVKSINTSKLSSVISEVKNLINLSKSMTNLNTSGMSDFAKGLNDLGKAGIDKFIQAFDSSTSKIQSAAKQMVTTFIEAANAQQSKMGDAFTNLVSGIVTNLNKSGDDFKKVGDTFATKLYEGLKQKEGTIKTSMTTLINNIVSAIRTKYSDFREAGVYLVSGFSRGMNDYRSQANETARSLARSVVNSMKNELQIHSPSRVTRDEVGRYIVEGISEGITSDMSAEEAAAKKAQNISSAFQEEFDKLDVADTTSQLESELYDKAEDYTSKYERQLKRAELALAEYQVTLETLGKNAIETQQAYNKYLQEEIDLRELAKSKADEAYQNSLDWIEKNKEASELSLIEELAAWNRVQSRYMSGTEERLKADEEVLRLQEEIKDATEDYYEELTTIEAEANDKRLELDRDYEEQRESILEEANNKRLELEQEYADKKQSINDQLIADIEAVEKAYEDAVKSRSDTLYDSYGLFDAVKQTSSVSGETLINNLQGQLTAFEEWTNNINSLSAKGVDSELIDELREMGPSSAAEIKALNEMTDEQLSQYVELWKKKHQLATDQATFELEDMREETKDTIAQLKEDARKELKEYRKTWEEELEALNEDTDSQLDELKSDWLNKIEELDTETSEKLENLKTNWMKTVTGLKTETENEFANLTLSIVGLIGDRSQWSATGANIIEGVLNGVMEHTDELVEGIEDAMNEALQAARKTLGINSPYKKFAEIGRYSDEGFVVGIKKYSNLVTESTEEVGKKASDSLRNSIRKIADVINGDIDVQPTIRPVLDLSDVEMGSKRLNTLFSQKRAVSVNTDMNQNGSPVVDGSRSNSDIKPGDTYFVQNNYSPKELSRAEIYRQTKNQFSAFVNGRRNG